MADETDNTGKKEPHRRATTGSRSKGKRAAKGQGGAKRDGKVAKPRTTPKTANTAGVAQPDKDLQDCNPGGTPRPIGGHGKERRPRGRVMRDLVPHQNYAAVSGQKLLDLTEDEAASVVKEYSKFSRYDRHPDPLEVVDSEKKRRWLDGYETYGTIRAACEYSGASRITYYLWTQPRFELTYDPHFVHMVGEAYKQYSERVFREVNRRALEGVEEPVYGNLGNGQGTGIIGTRMTYSDRMLELLIKRIDRSFRDPPAGVQVNVGVGDDPMAGRGHSGEPTMPFNPKDLTPEQRGHLRRILEIEAQRHGQTLDHDGDATDAEFTEVAG